MSKSFREDRREFLRNLQYVLAAARIPVFMMC